VRSQDSPTLADLLRHHLASSASQSPSVTPVWPINTTAQPQPARPHALELAPMTLGPANHVVWTDNPQPQFAGPQSAMAYDSDFRPTAASQTVAPSPATIPITTAQLAAAVQPALPAWAEAAAQPRTQRYGLWAGGALAALVVGLGMMLHAGRHPEVNAPPEAATAAAEISDAAETQPSDEPVTTASVDVAPEPERMDTAAAIEEPSTGGNPQPVSPAAPEPESAPSTEPPKTMPETSAVPAQGALLPSAQNWMQQNAPPEPVTGPSAPKPKAKPPAAPADFRATGALGKPKAAGASPPSEPAGTAPKSVAKNTEVKPFKTAVVKAPQETLFAPVLLELKNADSLMRVFEDLQRRHSALAGKRAEVRPAAGPNNETWFALLAVPAVSKAEADAICRAMGSEGATLRCRTIKY
jgi:hypothetical protein